MESYATDDETVESLRKWWAENGAWIVAGLLLGAASLFGWRYWVEYREQTLATASDAFEQVLVAGEQEDHAHAVALAAEIRGLRLPTPYADMAALAVARQTATAGDTASAQVVLVELMEGSRDLHVTHLARLRLTRLVLAAGDLDAADRLLQVAESGAYAPLYAELRGDLALARGDRQGAIAAYRDALAGAAQGIVDRSILEMKLNDLGAPVAARDS